MMQCEVLDPFLDGLHLRRDGEVVPERSIFDAEYSF